MMGKSSKFLGGFLLAAFAPLVVRAQLPAVAELPAPKVGEVWKYRITDVLTGVELSHFAEELVEIRGDRLVFRRPAGEAAARTVYFGRSLAACQRLREGEAEMCDGQLTFPMRVGNKSSYDNRPWRDGDGVNSAECEVKAMDKVTVPAGTFDAFRVECEGAWQRMSELQKAWVNSGRIEESYWYAPSVNNVVKSTYVMYGGKKGGIYRKTQTELTEFVAK
ncbi:MAG: hypothetical protein NFW04_08985 [Candidatus Accumulibacter sp.]|uniref:hypothetical protein n=1 Tax=Accumulibacter sp. TaxID=2053492 RepID=UPI0025F7A5D7|nr:hypothetical protein [Accumulibacter sp.]MCM8598777.1 hypothetical protein [Accumulibacter sp.]MCM8663825.1 hypothetical protein [Accumulibacter sp.]